MMYLVAKAREEGWRSRGVSYFDGGEVTVQFIRPLSHHCSSESHTGQADTEPLATAYAVAKILGVKLPEGVE
jgi:hypothetical protein